MKYSLTVGGMESTHKGHDFRLRLVQNQDRPLLVKELLKPSPTRLSELNEEIEIIATLSRHDGFPALAHRSKSGYQRDYIAGEKLKGLCGHIGWQDLLHYTAQLARLLSFSHQNRITLGDLKPANLVLTPEKKICFVDLSLAQRFDTDRPYHGGSLPYMAPELFYNGRPSPQTDFYALGATLYEMTTGHPPFSGRNLAELAKAHWCEDPRDPAADTDLPAPWGCLILRLLNKRPSDRFLDANDIITYLNTHFKTKFAPEPQTVPIQKLIEERPHWLNHRSQAQATINAILQLETPSPGQSELAARLAYDLGKFREMDPFLAGLDRPTRARLEALRALKLGNLKKARQWIQELLPLDEITAMSLMGTLAYYANDLSEAENCYNRVLTTYRRRNAYPEMIRILNNLANIKVARHEFPAARDLYQKALALAEVSADPRQEATALASLGYLAHRDGRWGKAIRYYQRAVDMYDWLGLATLKTHNLINLAHLITAIGCDDKALSLIHEIELVGSREKNSYLLGHAAILRGDLERKSGRFNEAMSAYQSAISFFESGKNLADQQKATLALIRLLIENGKPSKVLEDKAGVPSVAKIRFYKDLWRLANKPDEIEPSVRLEVALEDETLRLDGEERLTLLMRLSHFFRAKGDFKRARAYHEKFIRLKERMGEGLDHAMAERFHATYPTWEVQNQNEQLSQALSNLSPPLVAELNVNELLKNILDKFIEYTDAQRGFILIKKSGDLSEITISRRFDRRNINETERQICWSVAKRVIDTAEPIVTLDASADQRVVLTDNIHSLNLKTIICLPFVYRGNVLGAVYLDSRMRLNPRRIDVLGALRPFAAQMSEAIFNARLFQKHQNDLVQTRQRLRDLEIRLGQNSHVSDIVCHSPAMKKIMGLVEHIADTDIPVLITGESGVGKERIARLIHELSPRHKKRFVSINCGAIPENLLESEFFGYRRGAFTGADTDKKGLLEVAHEGTLFLDEIGEMPLFIQVKLLRVLQENEFMPLGSDKLVKVNFRLISATNQNLADEVRKNNFREDLYYRIKVADIHVPPLRERREDIPYLVQMFAKKFAKKENMPVRRFDQKALDKLMLHPWPGNVRELENLVYKTVIFSGSQNIEDIEFADESMVNLCTTPTGPLPPGTLSLFEAKKQFERDQIIYALKKFNGNVTKAARFLKVARPRLSHLLKDHHINRIEFVESRT